MLWGTHQRRLLRHEFKSIKTLYQLVTTTLGICDPSVAPNLSQVELLSTETMSGSMSVNKNSQPEVELQKTKGKVSTFRDFPLTMDWDGSGLFFSYGLCLVLVIVMAYVLVCFSQFMLLVQWCCLCAEFCLLNGSSMMELAVLRSGAVLQLPVTSTKQLVLNFHFLSLAVTVFFWRHLR